jgi:hypothetical protein
MLLLLNVHHSRVADLVAPDLVTTDPTTPCIAIAMDLETGAGAS